jgi:hypothetical protein
MGLGAAIIGIALTTVYIDAIRVYVVMRLACRQIVYTATA